jgi:hypothetical protein
MPLYSRRDPGPCPVCQAPHTICTAPGPTVLLVPQLPARDGNVVEPPLVGALPAPPLVAELLQPTLAPDEVTTGTYHRKGRR